MKLLITGGAGFIGSAVIRHLINNTKHSVLNIDKLTYAGNLSSLTSVSNSERYQFQQVDICDFPSLKAVFFDFKPDAVMHLAAESHVDRSISGSSDFIQTNIVGTYNLLETTRLYRNEVKPDFHKFHHISTDEVFGDLEGIDDLFNEQTPYAPSSPYSASKASSDHLVRAWHRTYNLPVVITNCSNNYGPFHFPEKLIPLTILNALAGKAIPVYGNGQQIRDWLYVDDHARALTQVLEEGEIGNTYCIGGHNEKTNLDVVRLICDYLDELAPNGKGSLRHYNELITFVADRPGHDVRYAIDATKIKNELGWIPQETFETGLKKTVEWFIDNADWWQAILAKNKK